MNNIQTFSIKEKKPIFSTTLIGIYCKSDISKRVALRHYMTVEEVVEIGDSYFYSYYEESNSLYKFMFFDTTIEEPLPWIKFNIVYVEQGIPQSYHERVIAQSFKYHSNDLNDHFSMNMIEFVLRSGVAYVTAVGEGPIMEQFYE